MNVPDPTVTITPAARALGLSAVVLVGRGLANGPADAALDAWAADICAQVRRDCTPGFLAADPVLAGYRALHARIGRSNRRFPPSPDKLIDAVLRRGRLGSVNRVVDVYNHVSLATRLSLGAHRLDALHGAVTLGLTRGGERFLPIGTGTPLALPAGEYAYLDGRDEAICRMECTQGDASRVDADARDVLFIVQGHAGLAAEALSAGARELAARLARYCGGALVALDVRG